MRKLYLKEFFKEIFGAFTELKNGRILLSLKEGIVSFKSEGNDFMPEKTKTLIWFTTKISGVLVMAFFMMLIIKNTAKGQAGAQIVNDPVANARLGESVAQTAKVVQSTSKTLQILKKTMETVEKVSGAVQNIETLSRVTRDQVWMTKRIQQSYNEAQASDLFSSRELSNMMNNYNRLLRNTEKEISLISTLLQNGVLKMNDAERIEQLQKLESAISQNRRSVSNVDSQQKSIMYRRRMIKQYNKQTVEGLK